MSPAPMFSVLTPTLNALPRLRRCVGSLRGQGGVRFEHLVRDGGSHDGTVEWLRTQPDLGAVSEPDGGMYDAINRGWRGARGDVLCWLNSDEQYLPGTLARVAAFFDTHPRVEWLSGNALVVDGAGGPIAARREIRPARAYIANGFLNVFSCTLFFRRSLLERGLLTLDASLRYAADMDLVLRLLAAGSRHAHLGHYLSLFTLDGANLSCHPAMLSETEQVGRRHGRLESALVRRMVMCGRYLERLVSGSYAREDVSYEFAEDERPTYRRVRARRVPGSYRTR